VTVGSGERGAGVETDFGLADHQIVGAKTVVLQRVRHFHQFILENGVGAKGEFARGFGIFEPHFAFEPLPCGVNEGDRGNGGAANPGGEMREIVKSGSGGVSRMA